MGMQLTSLLQWILPDCITENKTMLVGQFITTKDKIAQTNSYAIYSFVMFLHEQTFSVAATGHGASVHLQKWIPPIVALAGERKTFSKAQRRDLWVFM